MTVGEMYALIDLQFWGPSPGREVYYIDYAPDEAR
jgi:hypothetical protein